MKVIVRGILPIVLSLGLGGIATAEELPKAKQTALGLYATAFDAARMREGADDVLLIDVRTRAEAAFVGIAEGVDRNIPYMEVDDFWEFDEERGTYKLEVNPDFARAVGDLVAERGLGKDATILLMCRSGSRSARAADLLQQLGYSRVYSVTDGFEGDKGPDGRRSVNGWKNAGLKWTDKLPAAVAYRPD